MQLLRAVCTDPGGKYMSNKCMGKRMNERMIDGKVMQTMQSQQGRPPMLYLVSFAC